MSYHNNTILDLQFKKARHFRENEPGFAICRAARIKL